MRCADLARVKDGTKVEVAGIVLIRQRPGSTNVTFITIEDETGIANAILWQQRFQAQRRIVMTAAMIGVKGTVQKEGEVIHVIADRLEDMTPLLHSVGEMHFPHRTAPGDGASGGGGQDISDLPPYRRDLPPFQPAAAAQDMIRPKSRNFH